jgi:hypothetical protein
VNVDDLVAIDVHTHAERNAGEPQDPVTEEVLEAAGKYFGGSPSSSRSTTRPAWAANDWATPKSSRPPRQTRTC